MLQQRLQQSKAFQPALILAGASFQMRDLAQRWQPILVLVWWSMQPIFKWLTVLSGHTTVARWECYQYLSLRRRDDGRGIGA
jgi:hypothetical protein